MRHFGGTLVCLCGGTRNNRQMLQCFDALSNVVSCANLFLFLNIVSTPKSLDRVRYALKSVKFSFICLLFVSYVGKSDFIRLQTNPMRLHLPIHHSSMRFELFVSNIDRQIFQQLYQLLAKREATKFRFLLYCENTFERPMINDSIEVCMIAWKLVLAAMKISFISLSSEWNDWKWAKSILKTKQSRNTTEKKKAERKNWSNFINITQVLV